MTTIEPEELSLPEGVLVQHSDDLTADEAGYALAFMIHEFEKAKKHMGPHTCSVQQVAPARFVAVTYIQPWKMAIVNTWTTTEDAIAEIMRYRDWLISEGYMDAKMEHLRGGPIGVV